MDNTQTLEYLGFMDSGEFPASDLSTYDAMVATWRHPTKQPPTEADMLAAWEIISLAEAVSIKKLEIDAARDEKKSLPILSEGFTIDAGDLQVGEMAATLFLGRGVSVEIVSLTFSGGRAYAITQKKHHLVDGQTVTAAGADQAEYNATASVTVTGKKAFDFAISGTPVSPATGTLSFSVGSFQHIPTTNETTVLIDEIVYAQIAADLKGYIDACQIRARVLKNEVMAAVDVAAVDAIVITTGWPATT